MPSKPAWRVDDAAAYEAMRAIASAVLARLIAQGDVAEAAEVRQTVNSVDGFDREAVDELTTRLTVMIGSPS